VVCTRSHRTRSVRRAHCRARQRTPSPRPARLQLLLRHRARRLTASLNGACRVVCARITVTSIAMWSGRSVSWLSKRRARSNRCAHLESHCHPVHTSHWNTLQSRSRHAGTRSRRNREAHEGGDAHREHYAGEACGVRISCLRVCVRCYCRVLTRALCCRTQNKPTPAPAASATTTPTTSSASRAAVEKAEEERLTRAMQVVCDV
jgi:hypothetical protein